MLTDSGRLACACLSGGAQCSTARTAGRRRPAALVGLCWPGRLCGWAGRPAWGARPGTSILVCGIGLLHQLVGADVRRAPPPCNAWSASSPVRRHVTAAHRLPVATASPALPTVTHSPPPLHHLPSRSAGVPPPQRRSQAGALHGRHPGDCCTQLPSPGGPGVRGVGAGGPRLAARAATSCRTTRAFQAPAGGGAPSGLALRHRLLLSHSLPVNRLCSRSRAARQPAQQASDSSAGLVSHAAHASPAFLCCVTTPSLAVARATAPRGRLPQLERPQAHDSADLVLPLLAEPQSIDRPRRLGAADWMAVR